MTFVGVKFCYLVNKGLSEEGLIIIGLWREGQTRTLGRMLYLGESVW